MLRLNYEKFGASYRLCVCMEQWTDGVMKNKPVFCLNYGSFTFYCVKGILHPIILNTNSLITAMLSVKRWYCEMLLWWNGIMAKWWNSEMSKWCYGKMEKW